MAENPRECWLNCYWPGDEVFLNDCDRIALNSMEDSLMPLDETAAAIRALITGFEVCYHEADIEAKRIIVAIGNMALPPRSKERPPARKQELQNARDILSAWCNGDISAVKRLDVGEISTERIIEYLGDSDDLKNWQIRRVVDRIDQGLDLEATYHNIKLNLTGYGEESDGSVGEHYKDQPDFLNKTLETMIHDKVDGQSCEISLAMAIDLLFPCHWDFVESLMVILKAIGGDLNPDRPYTSCSRNISMIPLKDELLRVADSLSAFYREDIDRIDAVINDSLGQLTDVKRWLAGSLAKTIELQFASSKAIQDFWKHFK